MPAIAREITLPRSGSPELDATTEFEGEGTGFSRPGEAGLGPNRLVRWAFYLSVFCIPFIRVYVPGSGDKIGVTRIVQAVMLCAVLSQPRVCIRLVPTALFWFVAYCVARILAGLWLTPEFSAEWWPSTLDWLQIGVPWV